MKKKRKSKLTIFLVSFIILFFISSYYFIGSIIYKDNFKNLKSLLSYEQKLLIKRYIYPSRLNSRELEVIEKDIRSDIGITKSSLKLSNNKTLKKYKLNSGFYAGIFEFGPAIKQYISIGTGYIDFFENNIFVLSSRGSFRHLEKILLNDEVSFKQIKNNINDFIGIDQFNKSNAIFT